MSSAQEMFFGEIRENKIPALIEMAYFKAERKICTPLFDNDETATPYEKSIDKDYVIRENFDFSEEYSHLCDVTLRDYGRHFGHHSPEDPFSRKLDGDSNRELNFEIDTLDRQNLTVAMRGSMYGQVSHMDYGGWQIILDVVGVTKKDAKKLEIFQELLIEAYMLELQGNLKLALFTYFSAIESLVTVTLESFKMQISSELHYSLEHLAFDDKVKVAVRTRASPPIELKSISMWGTLMAELSNFKEVRNNIAHARTKKKVTQEQVDMGFACIALLYSFFKYKDQKIDAVRKRLFPKRALPYNFGLPMDQ